MATKKIAHLKIEPVKAMKTPHLKSAKMPSGSSSKMNVSAASHSVISANPAFPVKKYGSSAKIAKLKKGVGGGVY